MAITSRKGRRQMVGMMKRHRRGPRNGEEDNDDGLGGPANGDAAKDRIIKAANLPKTAMKSTSL